MITVKNLHKKFGDNEVLKGIDYQINKGEKIVIVGPSGSGKSTFLRCLNLLEIPTSGEVWMGIPALRIPRWTSIRCAGIWAWYSSTLTSSRT